MSVGNCPRLFGDDIDDTTFSLTWRLVENLHLVFLKKRYTYIALYVTQFIGNAYIRCVVYLYRNILYTVIDKLIIASINLTCSS